MLPGQRSPPDRRDRGLTRFLYTCLLPRLREAGVIEREIAIIRPHTLGWPLSLIVMVTLEREGARTSDEMRQMLATEPEVIEAWNVTGA